VASLSSLKNSDGRRVWQQPDKNPANGRRDLSTRSDQEHNNNRASGSLIRLVFNRVGVFRIHGSGSNLTGDFRIKSKRSRD
jgi:hypothetical protein